MTAWYDYPVTLLYGQSEGNGTVENGTDFTTPFHTPITAIINGVVTSVKQESWGGVVTIQNDVVHGQILPAYSYYSHLDTFNVKVGQHVTIGDLLGLSGGQTSGGNMPATTGSTGPHTEFGFTSGPAYGEGSAYQPGPGVLPSLDPTTYIDQIRSTPLPGTGLNSSGNGPATGGVSVSNLLGVGTDIVQRGGIIIVAIILLVVGVILLFGKQEKQAITVAMQNPEVAA